MSDQTALEYIRKSLQQGYTQEAIRAQLNKYGWSEATVNQAFKDLGGAAEKPADAPQPVGAEAKTPQEDGPEPAGAEPKKPSQPPSEPTPQADAASKSEPAPPPSSPQAAAKFPKLPKLPQRLSFLANMPPTRRWTVLGGAGVIIIILIVLGVRLATPSHSATTVPRSAPHPTRQRDINSIVAALGKYINAHPGQAPSSTKAEAQKLLICGKKCGAHKTSATLSVYDPSHVKFHKYAKGLSVPDASTVYIVSGATCQKDRGSIGGHAHGKHPFPVLLYDLPSSSGVRHKCFAI